MAAVIVRVQVIDGDDNLPHDLPHSVRPMRPQQLSITDVLMGDGNEFLERNAVNILGDHIQMGFLSTDTEMSNVHNEYQKRVRIEQYRFKEVDESSNIANVIGIRSEMLQNGRFLLDVLFHEVHHLALHRLMFTLQLFFNLFDRHKITRSQATVRHRGPDDLRLEQLPCDHGT